MYALILWLVLQNCYKLQQPVFAQEYTNLTQLQYHLAEGKHSGGQVIINAHFIVQTYK